MIQCENCEFYERDPQTGHVTFTCDPFSNVKEPECIQKWQLVKINQMLSCYKRSLNYQDQFAPIQEKMFKFMENEIKEIEDANSWRDENEEEEFFENDDEDYLGDPDAWKN